ncbi:hypothetical protein GO988_04905 [Hymenobacter sp. HMF4947]|uniref:Uncharacterized protein n=1 Tax=Hymenobacter ginkgonis TaxID=2682976 RepID=A0A7K1TB74_9BACT|nr:hypothetical protein [Hymenobacter ginkgonis]MVN75660.1 hypothetical protein [Hymenobacter ginkgonis]
MEQKTIIARLAAADGGTLNWAVLTSGTKPNTQVHTMLGDETQKEVAVRTEADGTLDFGFVVNAFPATSWKLTLTEQGQQGPRYEREGLTDSQYTGRDSGKVNFSQNIS